MLPLPLLPQHGKKQFTDASPRDQDYLQSLRALCVTLCLMREYTLPHWQILRHLHCDRRFLRRGYPRRACVSHWLDECDTEQDFRLEKFSLHILLTNPHFSFEFFFSPVSHFLLNWYQRAYHRDFTYGLCKSCVNLVPPPWKASLCGGFPSPEY